MINSLHPVNKAVLLELLRLLVRVAALHPENKMTAKNLGICFGPVLHSSGSLQISFKAAEMVELLIMKAHIL